MRLVFGRILDDGERTIAMLLSCEMYLLHSIVSWILLLKEGHKEELKFMDLWIIAYLLDGKLFKLAYLFLKHMNNVTKWRQKIVLVYRVILTKIFIAFDVNVEEYEDGRDIGRDHIYNDIKLRKLGMISIDNVWIYDSS